jgi:YHS domain-containing protein
MNTFTPTSRLTGLLTAPAVLCFLATAAWSGEFYEKNGVAITGHDPVAYFSENKPVAGSVDHAFEYKGSKFLFSSKANMETFAADPQRYAPQYGGFCAFGTAGGYKAAIDPAAFTIVDGKLYLNYSLDVRTQWSADVPGFIAKADKNWPEVSIQTKVFE